MRAHARKALRTFLDGIETGIFWARDFSRIIDEQRQPDRNYNLDNVEMLQFLMKEGLVRRAEFKSRRYPSIVRYLRGSPSPYELAVSLRQDSFLSHKTALTVHGLEPPTIKIYVNKEQAPKAATEGMTQEAINRAFKNAQRQSKYIFRYGGSQFVLINGKNTGRAGVVPIKTSNGATVDATDLERTLIDIVVRPAYAGGIKRVFSVYKQAAPKIDVDHMIALLQKLNYAYPYHQSIGFLLYRVGRPERDCKRFKDFGLEFDFFLDYRLKYPAYDRNWRLYCPSNLR